MRASLAANNSMQRTALRAAADAERYGAGREVWWWLSLAALIAASPAFGWENILVHQHYARIVGILPEPYSSIELEISLNEETDDAEVFRVIVGKRELALTDEDMAKLKDLEIGTLKLEHAIYRDGDDPNRPSQDFMPDIVWITIELGPRYRIEYDDCGEVGYHWGRDGATIAILRGAEISVEISKLWHPDRVCRNAP